MGVGGWVWWVWVVGVGGGWVGRCGGGFPPPFRWPAGSRSWVSLRAARCFCKASFDGGDWCQATLARPRTPTAAPAGRTAGGSASRRRGGCGGPCWVGSRDCGCRCPEGAGSRSAAGVLRAAGLLRAGVAALCTATSASACRAARRDRGVGGGVCLQMRTSISSEAAVAIRGRERIWVSRRGARGSRQEMNPSATRHRRLSSPCPLGQSLERGALLGSASDTRSSGDPGTFFLSAWMRRRSSGAAKATRSRVRAGASGERLPCSYP
jgi:hypothetical protein